MATFKPAQYLNWDVPADRQLITQHAWSPKARLVVFDEIHKMRDWKTFLKGAWDGRTKGQAMLVTGSARMETFRQGGESLAGRYYSWRLHPFSVRELMVTQGVSAGQALARLLERGGFSEPCSEPTTPSTPTAGVPSTPTDLVREDARLSRVHEVRSLQLLFDLLRERVGSPLTAPRTWCNQCKFRPRQRRATSKFWKRSTSSFASRPGIAMWRAACSRNPRSTSWTQGWSEGDAVIKLENTVAAMLLKHCHHRQDAEGKAVTLHTIRDKERHEIDFVLGRAPNRHRPGRSQAPATPPPAPACTAWPNGLHRPAPCRSWRSCGRRRNMGW